MSDRQMLDLAWGLIANASNGNWNEQSAEWQAAAARWRDKYMPAGAATFTRVETETP